MSGPAVVLRFLGDSASLDNTFKKVEGESSAFGSKLAGAGKAIAGTLIGAGAAAAAFGAKSAATFATVGGEVSKLTRLTGGSAEEMSAFRFAANQSGLATEDLGKSLGTLSKHLSANDKAAKAAGIAYRDAKGNALPLNKVLLNLSDKFKSMPNGIDKNALALSLFGKAGLQMVPFLNKGSDALVDLQQQARKFGLVLTQDNLDAIRKNVVAHREFSAAMQGLQVQVGQYVLPAMTQMASFATATLVPAIATVSTLARQYLGPAFSWAFGIAERVMSAAAAFAANVLFPAVSSAIEGIVRVLKPFADKAREAFEIARDAVEDKLIPALRDKLMPILSKVAGFVTSNLGPALAGLGIGAVVGVATQMGDLAGAAVSLFDGLKLLATGPGLIIVGIAALAAGLVYAYKHSEKFRNIVDDVAQTLRAKLATAVAMIRDYWPTLLNAVRAVVDFFQGSVLPVLQRVGQYLVGQFSAAVAWFQSIWPQIEEAVGHVMNAIRDVITVVVNVVMALWRAWGDDLTNVVGTAWNYVQETISNALTVIRGVITLVLAIINGDWGKAWDSIKSIVGAVWNQIGNVVSTGIGFIREIIGGTVSTLGQVWAGLWNGMAGVVDSVWVSIQNGVRSGINFIIDAINVLIRGYNLLPFHDDIKELTKVSKVTHGGGGFGADHVYAGGFRAGGGDVHKGRSYVVGERGREILTMGGRGYVSPLGGGSGPAVQIGQVVVHASGYAEGQQAGQGFVDAITQYFRTGGARPAWANPV